ncbi:Receptor-type tyrosine-protein phosphatase O [Liparis tanakae]|uniref:Receptor-type tyrosine-protein phosphatase O n=1 Tax=Liparis tanakae TaxID=230148 RepID=A0A4Z2E767_9TELE|nr:Receptor-type tyrosine-protein phosphatase O [Liparis tanakae]
MSRDSAYKFSLQFEVRLTAGSSQAYRWLESGLPLARVRLTAGSSQAHRWLESGLPLAHRWLESGLPLARELKSVGLDLSHDAADLPVNRPKNRYTNILPCESLSAKHSGGKGRSLLN